MTLLRRHRAHQAELKLANGTHYHDHGLVFAREWGQLQRKQQTLGQPLQLTRVKRQDYANIMKVAGVRRITFHGLRHTCATLLLQGGYRRRSSRSGSGTTKLKLP